MSQCILYCLRACALCACVVRAHYVCVCVCLCVCVSVCVCVPVYIVLFACMCIVCMRCACTLCVCVCVCVCVCACTLCVCCVCVCACTHIVHTCLYPTFKVEVQYVIQLRGGVQLELLAYLANNLRSHSEAATQGGGRECSCNQIG